MNFVYYTLRNDWDMNKAHRISHTLSNTHVLKHGSPDRRVIPIITFKKDIQIHFTTQFNFSSYWLTYTFAIKKSQSACFDLWPTCLLRNWRSVECFPSKLTDVRVTSMSSRGMRWQSYSWLSWPFVLQRSVSWRPLGGAAERMIQKLLYPQRH